MKVINDSRDGFGVEINGRYDYLSTEDILDYELDELVSTPLEFMNEADRTALTALYNKHRNAGYMYKEV